MDVENILDPTTINKWYSEFAKGIEKLRLVVQGDEDGMGDEARMLIWPGVDDVDGRSYGNHSLSYHFDVVHRMLTTDRLTSKVSFRESTPCINPSFQAFA